MAQIGNRRPYLFIGAMRDRTQLLEVVALITPPADIFIITAAEGDAAARASERYEQTSTPTAGTWTRTEANKAGHALLEAALGGADAVDMAIGRPRAGSGKKGVTPTYSIRWGVERIRRGEAQAATEGIEFSAHARRPLDEYLERHTA